MERFTRDPASKHEDHMIDTTTGEPLRVRVVDVLCTDSQKREYVAIFGGVNIPFYLKDVEDVIFDIPYVGITRRKVLLSGTAQVDGLDVTSIRSRIVAIEDHYGSGHYVPCSISS
jgi:hypothetical protein